jgi:hypothetical protein
VSQPYDATAALGTLREFQRATAKYAFRRLYLDSDSSRRFLVADETGLGKTHVAKGVIALTLEHLQDNADIRRIDVVYVCSNLDIADQNLHKLDIVGGRSHPFANRLTMLAADPTVLNPVSRVGRKPVNFVSFTPGTSFTGGGLGKAGERAILFLILEQHFGWGKVARRRAARILRGGVARWETFLDYYVEDMRWRTNGRLEPHISKDFIRRMRKPGLDSRLERLMEVLPPPSRRLNDDQQHEANQLVAELRLLLARAGAEALEPDLIILDEFQRFKHLLDGSSDDEGADLATHLFEQPDARVLLLSATPYKPFTFAEDNAGGDDHYEDFIATLRFLAGPDAVHDVEADLAAFRRAALAGDAAGQIRDRVQASLRRMLSRTERPTSAHGRTRPDAETGPAMRADDVRAEDVSAYVALHALADELDAPISVEYWKSAPYFVNFLDGYKIGTELRAQLREGDDNASLRALLASSQRLDREAIERFEPVEWGSARLRSLAAHTVEQGWWRMLWMPPSMPYHELGGAFGEVAAGGLMTKQLIFSSWVAAPSAIASLLSYEAERQIFRPAGHERNTPEDRRSIRRRLDYRLDPEGRPAAMTTLALFWPAPTLAARTDPLRFARTDPEQVRSIAELLAWALDELGDVIGDDGESAASASTAWYWAAPLLAEQHSELGRLARQDDPLGLAYALVGQLEEAETDDPDATGPSRGIVAYAHHAFQTLQGEAPDVDRPADLRAMSALLGVAAPGNVAWRALGRLRRTGDEITDFGHWRAATHLASGLRAVFNRPEAIVLLDAQDRADQAAYWQTVLGYCLDGDLQAVMDEFLHHLAEAEGIEARTDDDLMELARRACRAISARPARYLAFDPDRPGQRDGIPMVSRFALRFGNIKQDQDDLRLPEIRAAFNSPFWPFVLATTSIGQEGVDFHWWCHAVVHWNLPANPVDFEQREGRVNRYKGHAIRKNVAHDHRAAALLSTDPDPWRAAFAAAASGANDVDTQRELRPYWVYPGPATVERYIPMLPLSRDQAKWRDLQALLALYRLAYGQPRQDDMVSLLDRHGVQADDERLGELRLDLHPPSPVFPPSSKPVPVE